MEYELNLDTYKSSCACAYKLWSKAVTALINDNERKAIKAKEALEQGIERLEDKEFPKSKFFDDSEKSTEEAKIVFQDLLNVVKNRIQ